VYQWNFATTVFWYLLIAQSVKNKFHVGPIYKRLVLWYNEHVLSIFPETKVVFTVHFYSFCNIDSWQAKKMYLWKQLLKLLFSSPDPKHHWSSVVRPSLAWRPSWLEVGITGHKFGRGPSKDHSTKVWFKLAQWFQRSWLKCEKLTDGRRTPSEE
jgi:hypothetical protein